MRVKLCGKPSRPAKRYISNDMLSAETAADYALRDGFLAIAVSDGKARDCAGRSVRRRFCLVLGFRFRRRAAWRTGRHVAARAGAAPLHLARPRAASARCTLGLRRSRRPGLAPRHRADGIRRPAARAVELHWLRLCAARPRQRHSAVVRRCRRPRAGAFHSQGSVAASPPRRRADYCAGSCGDRLRGIAHDGPSRAVWRSALCRRRQLIRGVRHAAAAVAGRTDACGRDNERAVARRPTDFVVRLRQSHRRWIC